MNTREYPGPYPEQISYRLTGMETQKNVPKKQNVKLLGFPCMFVKRKFDETYKDFSINDPYNSKCGKMIYSFDFSFNKTTKYIGTKLITQTNAINFIGTYI